MSNDAPAITDSQDITLSGHAGDLVGRYWLPTDPQWIAVLCHGYGEHIGRYDWVARTLNEAGAAVYGADHAGHGRSAGPRVLIADFEPVVEDLHRVEIGRASCRERVSIAVVSGTLNKQER